MTQELPPDIHYRPDFLAKQDYRSIYDDLLEEFFSQEPEPILFGGPRISNIAFRTDRPNSYTEGNSLTRNVLRQKLWLPATGMIAGRVAAITGVMPSLAVFNYYRDGSDYLAPHSDFDHQIGPSVGDVVVATVSFGASRNLHLTQIRPGALDVLLDLDPGSLFVMRGSVQREWLHAIPKGPTDRGPRLSITFLHHQLDPESEQCWVLSKFTEEQESQMSALARGDIDKGGFGSVVRRYEGTIPRPVVVGTLSAVFAAWCALSDWESHVVSGPARAFHRDPVALVGLHPELRASIPKDTLISFDAKSSSAFGARLPAPDSVPMEGITTDWLTEMSGLIQEELHRRAREASWPTPVRSATGNSRLI